MITGFAGFDAIHGGIGNHSLLAVAAIATGAGGLITDLTLAVDRANVAALGLSLVIAALDAGSDLIVQGWQGY